MGILHSTTRAIEGRDGESPIYPDIQNYHISSGDSSSKLLNLSLFIFKALKGLLRKVGSIFHLVKPADPLLPVQNPASSISTEPLLVQSPPIYSPATFDDEDLECDFDLCRQERDHQDHVDQFSITGSIFHLAKPADPLLPVQNPASSISTEPLLVQSPPIYSPATFDDEDLECDCDLCRQERDHQDHVDQFSITGSIFHLAKPADPLLPVQNPASSISTEPLLVQSPPIYSPATFDDEDLECDCDICRQERDHHDHVDQFSGSVACASASDEMMCAAVFVEENASRNLVEEMNSTEEKEEVVVEIKSVIAVREERWIKHYSSGHRILLVGEGNFSFSACLAVAFRCAPNIIATSLDSRAFLKEHYGNALANIKELRSRGSKVMHRIDATKMANHKLLGQLRFDRIIFNFPYVGLQGFKNLPRQSQLERQQKLVRQFLENAREMIDENGEIHITHKNNGFHREWSLVSLGRGCGLRLIEATKFNLADYRGYNTKCGFGGNGDFNCDPSKTYKFRL